MRRDSWARREDNSSTVVGARGRVRGKRGAWTLTDDVIDDARVAVKKEDVKVRTDGTREVGRRDVGTERRGVLNSELDARDAATRTLMVTCVGLLDGSKEIERDVC